MFCLGTSFSHSPSNLPRSPGALLQLEKEQQQAKDWQNVSAGLANDQWNDQGNLHWRCFPVASFNNSSYSTRSPIFRITNYNEAGFFVRLFRRIESEKERLSRAKQVALFETVEQFIEEFAGFSDLVLPNFRSIFFIYFLFGAFVLATFFVHRLVKFTKERIRFRRSFFYQNN